MSALPMRSMLFAPGDSEKKIAKAIASGADAVIFDIEDAVAPANKASARALVADTLAATPPAARATRYWVRVNPFDTGLTLGDLAAIVPHAPDGIIQPKTDGPEDVRRLSHYIDALEAAHGIAAGSIRIIPVATETAKAPFTLGSFADAHLERLAGITWGGEDLATALGATANRDGNGDWTYTFRMVRALTLLAAHAADVQAIDTLFVNFRDEEGLRAACKAAYAEGFSGRLAIHPAQVAIINECFMPSAEQIAQATRVVAAFAADPQAGTIGLDGKMFDIPHLKLAERTLRMAASFGSKGTESHG